MGKEVVYHSVSLLRGENDARPPDSQAGDLSARWRYTTRYVYLGQKQYDRALAAAERAVALDPNDAESYVGLADILSFAGRPEETLGLLEQAMRLSPRYPSFYLLVAARVSYLRGQYEEALTTLKKVLPRNPDHLLAHLHLAAVYSKLGWEVEARAAAAEVLRINPQFSLKIHQQRASFKDPVLWERHIATLRKAGLQ